MSHMSKRERLEAAVAGEAVDRLPVALWRHWPGDDQDADALTAAHLAWQRDYDWDFVKVSPSSSYCLHDWGLESRWEGHIEGTRSYGECIVSGPADWETLPVLNPDQGMLAVQLGALQNLSRHFGEETPFIATIFSPLAQAKNLAGGERMLIHMRSHPESFKKGLRTITESTLRFIEAAKATGISGIYYAIQHTRFPLMGPVEYQLFGQPYDEEILSAVSDLWLNMVHVHGRDAYLDIAADYPVQLFNWHDRTTGISLAEGLQQIAGAASGGVSRWSLHQESPERALREAADAVEQTGGRRLVLGAGCVIMVTTPLRNIRALREFAEQTPAVSNSSNA